jgi:hypothetical protein
LNESERKRALIRHDFVRLPSFGEIDMWTDPIVSEIHKVRSEIAAEHGNDIRKIGAHFMERQKEEASKLVKPPSQPLENAKTSPKNE